MKKDNLTVKVFETRTELGDCAAREAAQHIRRLLTQKEAINVIFAAAPSQNEFLAALAKAEGIDWQRIHAFHMDEYVGLRADAPQGFGNYLKKHIFSLVPFASVDYLDGTAADPQAECRRYTALLQAYPTDIVCMGIGENGHIAFNDPHVARFDDPEWVKVVDLDPVCRQQQVNDGCFATFDEVPTHALSLTIPTLMRASYLFCMVPAKTKAWAVTHTLSDPISEKIPATIMRRHANAVMYVDKESAVSVCGL